MERPGRSVKHLQIPQPAKRTAPSWRERCVLLRRIDELRAREMVLRRFDRARWERDADALEAEIERLLAAAGERV